MKGIGGSRPKSIVCIHFDNITALSFFFLVGGHMFLNHPIFSFKECSNEGNSNKYRKNLTFWKIANFLSQGSKKHVKLIFQNSLLWFLRFLRNVKIQLCSEDMINSIFGGLDFCIKNRGVISGHFSLFLPIKSSILMLKAWKLSQRCRPWIEL